MRTTSEGITLIARIAAFTGYAAAKVNIWLRRASFSSSARNWRMIEVEGLRLRVPGDWGKLEQDASGRLILHNRPRRFRIDGDAVWYSMAIELRIVTGRQVKPRNAEAMTAMYRCIETSRGPFTLELAVANGVGPRLRAIAERVLRSAEPALSNNSCAREARLQ
jgi:hypothetical protein